MEAIHDGDDLLAGSGARSNDISYLSSVVFPWRLPQLVQGSIAARVSIEAQFTSRLTNVKVHNAKWWFDNHYLLLVYQGEF
jgi:hypothetical protein